VGWLTDIQRRNEQVRLEFKFDPDIQPIGPEQLKAMLLDLDIDSKSEVHRSHWAIKEVDLIFVLRKFKLLDLAASIDPKAFRFSRQTVIKACNLLSRLGHARFDNLLLEIGLNDIHAGRDKGGLQARATALGAFVVDHMGIHTIEGEPLTYVVVRRAAELDPSYDASENVTDPLRTEFWASLKRDGYGFQNGHLLPLAPNENPIDDASSSRPYQIVPPEMAEVASNMNQTTMPTPRPSVTETGLAKKKPKVFIVHGRDTGSKSEVARFLERLDLDPVILHERPNGGRTLIAKFQEESADIQFAIVLMTPDDKGGLDGGEQKPRARQNVIFELGFFIGKLGASKVCALVSGNIEKPSDFDAVVYVAYDSGGAWKTELARELNHAMIPIDPKALLR
jgi:predicted nucleotide-binding protein